jgi:hypothetical protein
MEMRLTALAAAGCLAMIASGAPAFAADAAAKAAQALDGRAFVADAGEKGKAADEKDDVITFAGGKFHSSACDQWGFAKGDYRASGDAGEVAFETETVSAKDGRLVWKGVVRGAEIEGTFVHYRKGWLLNPDPAPVEHWFKGRAKS